MQGFGDQVKSTLSSLQSTSIQVTSRVISRSSQIASAAMQSKTGQAVYGAALKIKNVVEPFIPQPVKDITANLMAQVKVALRDIFNPAVLTAVRKPHTQQALQEAAYTNFILYGLPFLLARELYEYTYPDEHSSPQYVQVYNTMILITCCLMIRRWLRMKLDTFLYTLAIGSAVGTENPNNNKILPPANNGKFQVGLADAVNIIDFYIRKTTANIIYGVPRAIAFFVPSVPTHYTDMVSYVIHSENYGRSFYDYKLSALKMNAKERQDRYTGNKLTLLLNGLFFLLLLEKTTSLFVDYPANDRGDFFYKNIFYPTENSFIYGAFFNFYFQCFSALSYLINQPLANAKPGLDLFYPSYALSTRALNYVSTDLEMHFRQNQTNLDLQQTLQTIQRKLNYPSVRWLAGLLLDDDLSSLDKLVRRPSVKLFLDHYEKTIKSIPEYIEEVRQDFQAQVLHYLPLNWRGIRNLVAYFNGQPILDLKKGVEIIMREDINPIIEAINKPLSARRKHIKEIEEKKQKVQMVKEIVDDMVETAAEEMSGRVLSKLIEKAHQQKLIKDAENKQKMMEANKNQKVNSILSDLRDGYIPDVPEYKVKRNSDVDLTKLVGIEDYDHAALKQHSVFNCSPPNGPRSNDSAIKTTKVLRQRRIQ